MGRDGTALLPSLCATVLLRIYPAEAESEIKMIFMFSLIMTNHLQKHWEKEQVCWVLTGFSSHRLCFHVAGAQHCHGNAAGWLGEKHSPHLQPGCSHRSNSQACAATCPFSRVPGGHREGRNIVPGRQGARLPADGLTPSPMALHNAHSAEE